MFVQNETACLTYLRALAMNELSLILALSLLKSFWSQLLWLSSLSVDCGILSVIEVRSKSNDATSIIAFEYVPWKRLTGPLRMRLLIDGRDFSFLPSFEVFCRRILWIDCVWALSLLWWTWNVVELVKTTFQTWRLMFHGQKSWLRWSVVSEVYARTCRCEI